MSAEFKECPELAFLQSQGPRLEYQFLLLGGWSFWNLKIWIKASLFIQTCTLFPYWLYIYFSNLILAENSKELFAFTATLLASQREARRLLHPHKSGPGHWGSHAGCEGAFKRLGAPACQAYTSGRWAGWGRGVLVKSNSWCVLATI